MAYPDIRFQVDTIKKAINRILASVSDINKQAGYGTIQFGENLNTMTSSSHRGLKPFIIGLIPPDNWPTFTPIQTTDGTVVSKIDLPKAQQAPSGAAKGAKGGKASEVENVAALPDSFWIKYVEMCDRIGAKPEDLTAVLLYESGLNPAAMPPPPNTAKGLNQLIRSTALGQGMPAAVYDKLETLSAEEQLPYVERYFQKARSSLPASAKGKWPNSGALYVANISGAALPYANDPNHIIYDGRGPRRDDGHPLKPGDPGYDKKVSQNQQNFDANKGLAANGESITVGDMTRAADGKKGGAAYNLALQKIDAGRSGIGSLPTVALKNKSGVSVSFMRSGSDITDSESNDPTQQLGRHIKALDPTDPRSKIVQDQVDELQKQIFKVMLTPPLILLVNPSSFRRHYEHSVDYTKGRRKPIVSMWLEKPMALSGKGSTAVQYAWRPGSGEGGITHLNRIASLSYQNLMSLVYVYRNNGVIFTSGGNAEYNRFVPLVGMSVYIYYDGVMYIGSFDNFTISDAADKPYNLEYDFNFTTRYEVQIESVLESSIKGGL